MEAAELLGVEVDDLLIVGLDDEHQVDESIIHPSSRLDEYKEGVLSEERDPSLKCDQCNFKTGDKWQLKIHIAAKHIGVMYDCDECQHQSAYKKNLKRHKRRAHIPLFAYNQGEKKEDEWSERELEINERRENMEIEKNEEFRVKERNENSEGNLVKFRLFDPPKESDPKTKPNLLNGQDTEIVSYKCDKCIFRTLDKYHLKKHSIAKHTGIRYDCDECDYQSAYKKSIKRHKWGAHKTIVEPSFTCDQCDNKYPFHSQDNLWQHIKKHHKSAI